MCSTVTKLPLNVLTLNPKCVKVETLEGVALTVTGVAQVMVSPDGAADMTGFGGGDHVVAEQPEGQQANGQVDGTKNLMLMKAVEQFSGKGKRTQEHRCATDVLASPTSAPFFFLFLLSFFFLPSPNVSTSPPTPLPHSGPQASRCLK